MSTKMQRTGGDYYITRNGARVTRMKLLILKNRKRNTYTRSLRGGRRHK